jgi:hypothetical protein
MQVVVVEVDMQSGPGGSRRFWWWWTWRQWTSNMLNCWKAGTTNTGSGGGLVEEHGTVCPNAGAGGNWRFRNSYYKV